MQRDLSPKLSATPQHRFVEDDDERSEEEEAEGKEPNDDGTKDFVLAEHEIMSVESLGNSFDSIAIDSFDERSTTWRRFLLLRLLYSAFVFARKGNNTECLRFLVLPSSLASKVFVERFEITYSVPTEEAGAKTQHRFHAGKRGLLLGLP